MPESTALGAEISGLDLARGVPPDVFAALYEAFLRYSAAVYREGYVRLGAVPFLDFRAMVRATPALLGSGNPAALAPRLCGGNSVRPVAAAAMRDPQAR